MIPQIYHIYPKSVIFCNSASSAVLPPATLWLNFNAWPLTRLAPCCLRNTLGADGLHLKGISGWGVARLWSPAGCSVAMLREGWISWTAAEWVPSAAQSEPPPLSRLYVELGVLLRYSTEGDQPAAQPGPAGGRELDRVDQLPVEEVCKKLQLVKKRDPGEPDSRWVSEKPAPIFHFLRGPTKLLYTAPFGDKVSLLSFLESNVWETRYNKINQSGLCAEPPLPPYAVAWHASRRFLRRTVLIWQAAVHACTLAPADRTMWECVIAMCFNLTEVVQLSKQ